MLHVKSNIGGGNKFVNYGCAKIYQDIIGRNNLISVSNNSFIDKCYVRIRGNNNRINFDDGVYCGKGCSFWMEGDNITIDIGRNSTFTRDIQLCAQEDDTIISLGEDCMLSNNIIIRTSDSHPIYNENGERINCARSVRIGNHVWIAPNSKIMKGAEIGDGSIIGSNTIVTKIIPQNVLVVGAPAKVVKENINWSREKLF